MLAHLPPARRIAISAVFCLCIAILIVTVFRGFAPDYPMRLFQGIAVAVGALGLLGGGIALIVTRLTDYREPADEDEFEQLVSARSGSRARTSPPSPTRRTSSSSTRTTRTTSRSSCARRSTTSPDLLIKALDHVAVVISDKGRKPPRVRALPGRHGRRDNYPDRIMIFRDTLLRDFGHDPDQLRAQVTRTVRHELAHHLGADELGVRELGL